MIFSDPHDNNLPGEIGFPFDGGIPSDTVQRGSAGYIRGDPTTPRYPSINGSYQLNIEDLIKETRENINGPHFWSPLPSQPISWGNDAVFIGRRGILSGKFFKKIFGMYIYVCLILKLGM